MKNYRNVIYSLLILFIFSGCKARINTFDTVYEKKLGAKPNYHISFKDDGSAVFGIQGKKSKENIIPDKAFYVSGDGKTVWTKKITRLGKIQKDPHFKIIWDEGVALFFSRTLFKFNLSCIDLSSQKELWHIEESNPGKYSYTGAYIPTENGIIYYTPNGLEMLDLKTGKSVWQRKELFEEMNFSDFFTGNNNSGYFFSKTLNTIFISKDNQLYALDPKTGEYKWRIEKPVGTVNNADLFETEGVAFFYGSEDKSLGEAIIRSSDARANQIMNVMEGGLVKKEIYFVDLNQGKLLWKNTYYSNGNDLHFLVDDKIIIANMITYAFDRQTGKTLWQSVSQDKIDNQTILKALKALNIIDLTITNESKPSDVVKKEVVYNIYPEVFENPLQKNFIRLRKYDINSGNVIWETEKERMYPSYFYQEKDHVYLVGGNAIPSSKLFVYDKNTGSKIYDINLPDGILDIVSTIDYLYVTYGTARAMMKVFDRRSGEEIRLDLKYGPPSRIQDVGNYIMAAYDNPRFKESDRIAFHNKSNWEVVKELSIPEYFNDFTNKNKKLFLTDFKNQERGIIDIDLENLTVHDYLITRTTGSFQVNGQDQLMDTYHLFITPDGEYIYETDGNKVRKLDVD